MMNVGHNDEAWSQRTLLHETLPALGGQTPLQAVTTAEGREMATILVDDIERLSATQTGFDAVIIERLREQLGLV